MRFAGRMARTLAMALALASLASGYYHFVRFGTRTGPFVPIVERFDLNTLVNRTVTFYIAEQGPAQMAAGDSLPAVVSQIRLAARAWNGVETSELRIAFGGLASPDAPQLSPGIDVIFDEVPPGLIAVGGPTARSEISSGPNGPFIPITRSVVMLRKDLSQSLSFSESFFLSLVHEFGHALGLQHTLTSGVMSTGLTRATTKGRPLSPDDVAGISLLYPTANFLASTGAITGRVAVGAEGLNAASVVALSPQGAAISAMTNPDGTFRIEGLPPGLYYVYAHPLPPAFQGEVSPANIVLPVDVDGRPIAAAGPFETRFYPGVRDPQQASTITVSAGAASEGVNFSVQRRTSLPVYAVQTYSFPGSTAVNPAYLTIGGARAFLVASGVGLVANGAPASSLAVSVVGGSANVPSGGVRAYSPDPRFLQVDFQFTPFTSEGSRHLIFSTANDLYVRPAGLHLVQKAPPSIASLTAGTDANGARIVTLAGSNLTAETIVLFDGAQAASRGLDEGGNLIVVPPAATGGHRAAVVALSPDGQSSLFLQGATPTFYEYEPAETAAFSISPPALPAGAESLVEITGAGTGFLESAVAAGFGSSDVRVKQLWAVSPTRVFANVAVSATSSPTATTVTVVDGLRLMSQPFGFRILPANARQLIMQAPVVDSSGRAGLRAGGTGQVRVLNLPEAAAVQVSLNDRPLQVVSVSSGVITFAVPANFPTGAAILRMINGADSAFPLAVWVDPQPPSIVSVTASPATPINPGRPANPGELLTLVVTGLADAGAAVNVSRVRVNVAGIDHTPSQIVAAGSTHQVQFYLGTTIPGGAQPMTVAIDGRVSSAFQLPVRSQ